MESRLKQTWLHFETYHNCCLVSFRGWTTEDGRRNKTKQKAAFLPSFSPPEKESKEKNGGAAGAGVRVRRPRAPIRSDPISDLIDPRLWTAPVCFMGRDNSGGTGGCPPFLFFLSFFFFVHTPSFPQTVESSRDRGGVVPLPSSPRYYLLKYLFIYLQYGVCLGHWRRVHFGLPECE